MWDLPKLGIESMSPVDSLLLGRQEAPLVLRSSSLLPGTQSFPETLSDRRTVQVLLRKQDVPSGVASQASFFFFFFLHPFSKKRVPALPSVKHWFSGVRLQLDLSSATNWLCELELKVLCFPSGE